MGIQESGEVFSIATFCKAYGISRALFYKLQSQGRAPRTFNVGRRVLISKDAAQAWLSEMEGTAA
jgi:predicted DNA-binding transcriptional regulator AlpA